MPVHKDKERGTYFFQVTVQQADGTSKRIKRRGFKTPKEAKLAEAHFLLGDDSGASITFNEISKLYLEWYKPRRKLSSYHVMENIVDRHLIPEFGNKSISKITPKMIMHYQNKVIAIFSPDFLKKIHNVLSAIFTFAIKYHNHDSNPAKIAGNFEVEKNRRINFWEYHEFIKFISVVDVFLYNVFFSVLYYSGARKGELLALTWEDISFDDGSIDINKTNYNGEITSPKTKASNRIILLPSFVMDQLSSLKESVAKIHVEEYYVVFGSFNKAIATSTLDRAYAQYLKKSEVKKIVMHEFRHSHASYLINKGVSPLVVSQRLGHSDVSTTLNTYSHLYPSKQQEVIEIMENDKIEYELKKKDLENDS